MIAPAGASAGTLNATPANLGSVFASAQAGDTILLAAGSYGSFGGAMKPGEVTLRPQSGAAVQMELMFAPASNITIDGVTLTEIEMTGATKNIIVRNSDIPGQTTFRTGELQNANILFDHNVHRDWNACASCGEGRIWLPENTAQPSGITIQNSEFRGGQSDGIQNGSNGTRIIDNTFHDLEPGSPSGVHTDAIQLYGSKNTLIKGNHFYNVPDAIMAPDGAEREVIEDNVIAADPDGYPYAVTLYSDDGSTLRHNTFADGNCTFNLPCGIVRVGAKGGSDESNDPGRGTVVQDNVLSQLSFDTPGTTVAENTFNLYRNATTKENTTGRPSYVGGARPTTYAGFALAPGSPGRGTASDGLDRGIRLGGGPQPPAGAPLAPRPQPPAGASPPAGGGKPADTAKHPESGRASARVSIRVLSSLRSIHRTGKLRLRLRTLKAGRITVSASIRAGTARRTSGLAHARSAGKLRTVKLRTVSLGRRSAGTRTVTLRVGRETRRRLGRSHDARLTLRVSVGGAVTTTVLPIRR